MSVLFLPPSAGAASVPDASETVKGIIRIATSAEATAGTDDLTSMTPAKVKSVVDAAVAGGVTYKGTFDAAAPLDLSNAVQGDLYIIDGAGTYQGKTWAVGDHLLVNADMGGTVDPAKIDKIDSTDSVTSVAGRTGAVVLSTADISGLATVATSGAYSDLSGTPTLATVATTGAYSDLTGTPTLGTAAALDVGTSANNVVQLDGTAKLPAVDGSQLTNVSATVAALNDIGDVDTTGVSTNNVLKYDGANWVDGSVAYSEVTGTPSLATIATTGDYSDLNDSVVVQQFNATATASAISSNALHVFRFYGAGGFTLTLSVPTAINGFALFNNVSGSDVTVNGSTFRANGEGITGGSSSITVKAGERRLYYVENASVYLEANSTLIGHNADVTISSPANGEALIYNSTSGDWENGTVSASVAALDDIGDVDTTGVSTNNVLKYDGANWVDGSVAYSEVTGTPTLATVATTGAYSDLSGTPSLATVATTGAYSDLTGTPTLGTAAALDVGTSANNVVQLDGTAKLPAVDGSQLTNLPSGASTLGALTDVTITSVADGEFLKYDSASGDWVNGDSGLYSGTTYSTTTTVPTPSQPQTLSIRLSNSSSQTLTLPTGSAALLGTTINLVSIGTGEWTINPAAGQYVRGLSSALTLNQNQTAILTLTQDFTWYVVAYEEQGLGDLFDVTVSTPANGEALIYNSTSGDWENGTVSATVAALNDIGDVSAAAPNNGDVIAYNSTSGDWEATAQSGGGGSAPSVTVSSPSTDQTLSAPSGIEEAYIYTPSANITVNLVAAATCGSGFKYQIKNRSTNTITIDPNGSETIDGSTSFGLSTQEASVTLITDGSNWFII